MSFSNKVVLITGGTRGIGWSCAKTFAQQGASIIMLFRQNLIEAQKKLEELGKSFPGNHRTLCCDVSDPTAIQSTIQALDSEGISIDILVNNAGIGDYHPFDNVSYDEWQKVWQETLATNLFGVANMCYCVAKLMEKNGGGQIVNVSSRGAFRGEPDKPAYGASKAGVNALSQSLAVTLADKNIFVSVVAPGFVETELTAEKLKGKEGELIKQQSPFNRVARPQDVANAVIYLASEESNFSTGTILDVNGASYLRS